ncbi:MAG: glutaredoxin family protein [Desulfuromonadales bacterium]
MKIRIFFALLAALLLISPCAFAAEESAGKTARVEIYTTSWCPYCVKAVKFLRANNIPFVEYDVEKDQQAARRQRELAGRGGVPFAIVNGQKIHGWSEQEYRRALELD